MAKLDRVLQKIFGQNGGGSEFGKIGSLAAGSAVYSKDLDTIQALTQYLEGLFAITVSGSEPPRIQDINALYLLITSQIKYLFQAGVPEWITTEEYYIGSICQVAGVLYTSKTGTTGSPNTGHAVSDTANWKKTLDIGELSGLGTGWAAALAADLKNVQLPIGSIIAFDGAWTDNVTMPGWYACVAANAGLGCPNLVDRFILGKAIAGSGALGGSNTHTIAAAELPVHTHDLGSHTHSTPAHAHSLSNHTHTVALGAHSHALRYGFGFGTLTATAGGGYGFGPNTPQGNTDSTDLGTPGSSGPSVNSTDTSGAGTTGAASGNTGNGGFANSAIDMRPANYSMVFVKRVY